MADAIAPKKTVLVVDDSLMQPDYNKCLTSDKYAVYFRDDSRTVLKEIGPRGIDVIIANCDMPYIDGTTILTEADKINKRIAKILVVPDENYLSDLKEILKARNVDAGYILKSAIRDSPESLLAIIEQLLSQSSQQ